MAINQQYTKDDENEKKNTDSLRKKNESFHSLQCSHNSIISSSSLYNDIERSWKPWFFTGYRYDHKMSCNSHINGLNILTYFEIVPIQNDLYKRNELGCSLLGHIQSLT